MSHGWEGLGVCPEIVQSVSEEGWSLPSDVQDESIPLILGGGDVMVAAETGSGKTGAFAIPIVQLISERRKTASKSATSALKESPAKAVILSPSDRSSVVAVDPSGFICQSRAARSWGGVRASVGLSGGCYYYEATMRDEGLCRVGFSTRAATYDLGCDQHGFGFGGTGKKSNNRDFKDYGEPFGKDDVIGCFVDMDRKSIKFSKNGAVFGDAFVLPKSFTGPLYPAICLKNAELHVNFGHEPFKNPPDAPWLPFCKAPVHHVGFGVTSKAGRSPQALVLEPSRDLAEQTYKAFLSMTTFFETPITCTLLIGGGDTRTAVNALKKGVDIVVGTPGRVLDFAKSGKMDLSLVKHFVMDEADRLCDDEGMEGITELFSMLPHDTAATGDDRLQVCFFSATLHSESIRVLSEKVCHRPTWVDLKGKDSVPETVHHILVPVEPTGAPWGSGVTTDGVHAKDRVAEGNSSPESLSEGVKRMKPQLLVKLIEKLEMDQALVFCRTNVDCDNLEAFLTSLGGGRKFNAASTGGKENPYSCCVLAGFRSMEERRRNLLAFQEGSVRFLICTDVAARGIDVKGLPYVVNMTLPDKSENYIHRIGRVGRADCMGLAISLVSTKKEKVWYHTCKNRGRGCSNTRLVDKGGCTIWYDEPDMLKQVETRLKQKITLIKPDFSLPEGIGVGVAYGASKTSETDVEVALHVDALSDSVDSLCNSEVRVQQSFLDMISRFNKT